MAEDIYMVAIVLLLPLTAAMLVSQTNPYHGLVIRGILGAVAALVYALFGAADVALTEALVGTMLSITLYAVAVRSSLNMRLGVVASDPEQVQASWETLLAILRASLRRQHMQLEVVSYPTPQALRAALAAREVHTICQRVDQAAAGEPPSYHLDTRVHRLYQLLHSDLPPSLAGLTYGASACDAQRIPHSPPGQTDSIEVQP